MIGVNSVETLLIPAICASQRDHPWPSWPPWQSCRGGNGMCNMYSLLVRVYSKGELCRVGSLMRQRPRRRSLRNGRGFRNITPSHLRVSLLCLPRFRTRQSGQYVSLSRNPVSSPLPGAIRDHFLMSMAREICSAIQHTSHPTLYLMAWKSTSRSTSTLRRTD